MSHDARKRETPGSSQLDEWGLLAWPAFEERRIDGWLLRFAEGHTKRANAVYPMNPLKADLSKAIARCERFYRDRGQPAIFRMTASCCPLELDRVLDQRGYAFIDRTWVLERALCQSSLQEPEESLSEIAMEIVPIEQWLDAFQRLGIMDVSSMALRRRLIRVVKGETIPLLAKQGERVLGLNLGIRTGEGIGLFGLYVGEDARRRGIGRGLVKAALQAGLAAGARTAYLQVEDSNEAARGLYEELGFQPSHDYWYRVSTSCAPTRRAIENHFD